MAKGKSVRAKDVMSYIITGSNGGSQESYAASAYPPDEVLKQDSELKPDIDYYLHKQILPPVERLCAPIALTNITRLAECLGLDTSKYRVSNSTGAQNTQDETIQPLDSQVSDAVRFADCNPLHFRCLTPTCRAFMPFVSLLDNTSAVTNAGLTCSTCEKPFPNLTVLAQLEHQIRQLVQRYYEGWLVCDDPSCGNRTRQMSVYGHRCLGPKGLGRGCLGKMHWEMGEKAVWNQLVFWERAFDVERAREKAKAGKGAEEGAEKVAVLAEVNRQRFDTLKSVVRAYLDKSGRQWVDMGSLFGFMV